MADDQNINDAPVREPAEFAGYFVGVTSGAGGSEMEWRLIPGPNVSAGLEKAETAVQPATLGSVAYMDSGDLAAFVDTHLGGLEEALAALLAPL